MAIKPSNARITNLSNAKQTLNSGSKPPINVIPVKLAPQKQTQAPPKAVSAGRNPVRKQQTSKRVAVKSVTRDISPDSAAKIRNIQNSGIGRILVIIGNGPSIGEIDLAQLKGINKVDILSINQPDQRVWPTKYWSFFDRSQLRRHQALWESFDGYLFNSTSIKEQRPQSMQFKNFQGQGWSKNVVDGLYIGRSSVYATMQIALWMNFKKIFIFGCLPDGEKILTNRGMIAIDALNPQDQVYTTEGFKQPTGYQRRWCESTMISLVTRMNNIPLNLTEEHPVLVERNGQEEFVRAGDIRVGDTAIYPIDQVIEDDQHDTTFWWLAGVYAAEGYIRPINNKYKYAVMCLGRHETKFQQKIIDAATHCFDCKTTGDKRNRPTSELIINNDYFGQFVEEHIGRGSTVKFLSQKIMRLSADKQAAFIAGYCEGDGSLFVRKKLNKHECTFSTASESLAECLQKLLLRFGVISSLIRSKRPSGFDRSNAGEFGIRYHINIIGTALDRLASYCGWAVATSGKGQLFGTKILNGRLRVRIRSVIHTAFKGYVNNIEVDGPHTYASRLLMTHNCDMNPDGLNGKLHFYGVNPDAPPESRAKRFSKEAESYAYASTVLSDEDRQRFVFCTDYNPWPFISKYGHMSHKIAIEYITNLSQALTS